MTRPAPTCPYCEKPARLLSTSAHLYHGIEYGPVWACEPCGAWVGCHKGTTTPLGRLADADLRRAKVDAHAAFDPLWRAKMDRDRCSKADARSAGYRWLADQLRIDPKLCHIGMFDTATCRRVVELCEPFHRKAAAR